MSHSGVSAHKENSRMIFSCSSSVCSADRPKNAPSICGAGIRPPATTFVRSVFRAEAATGTPM